MLWKEFAGTINESNGSKIYNGSRVLNSKNLNTLDGSHMEIT